MSCVGSWKDLKCLFDELKNKYLLATNGGDEGKSVNKVLMRGAQGVEWERDPNTLGRF